jgi:intracellular multiplication protein IcmK
MQQFSKYMVLLLGMGFSIASFADGDAASFANRGLTGIIGQQPSQPAPMNTGALSSALSLNNSAPATVASNQVTSSSDANGSDGSVTSVTTNPVVKQKAFSNLVNTLMPMSPDQIKALHYYYNQTRNAVSASVGAPPTPTSTSLIVNLSPGATPPVIRMASGFISTLVFLDSTGQPWPISSEDLGDPQHFNIQVDSTGTSLLVQSLSGDQTVANLAVMLKGLSTPIMITLLSGQSNVDYRVDMRVPRMGPNAAPQISSEPNVASTTLLNVLDGIPPEGSTAVQISDPDSEAWTIGGSDLYVRTRMNIISPSWVSSMSSGDGTHAYELPKTPVILALNNGQIVKLTIGDELNG